MTKERQASQTPEQTTNETITTVQKKDQSNAAQIQELKKAEFIANYQSALGTFLGPKLYEAIAPYLSFEKMRSYANQAIEAAGSAGADWVNSSVYGEQLDENQKGQLSSLFSGKADELAKEFLESEAGKKILNKLQEFVGENPWVVVSVGILAAAGAVLADMEIPELKKKFKLGKGFSASAGVDLGSLRNIAIQSVSAGLEYKSAVLTSALTVSHSAENGVTGKHTLNIGDEKRNLNTNTQFDEGGVQSYEVGGLYTFKDNSSISGKISGTRTSQNPDAELNYTTKRGNTTHSTGINYSGENNSISGNYTRQTENGFSQGLDLKSDQQNGTTLDSRVGYSKTTGDTTNSFEFKSHNADAYSLGYATDTKFSDSLSSSFGFDYNSKDGFTGSNSTTFGKKEKHIKTDLEVNEQGIKAYGLSGFYTLNDNTSLSGSIKGNSEQAVPNIDLQIKTKSGDLTHTGQIKYSGTENTLTGLYSGSSERLNYGLMLETDLTGNQLSKLGANIKYDPEGSDYYSASFQSDLLKQEHTLDLSMQKQVTDELTLRGTQGFNYNQDSGLSSNTELLGAYKMNNDLSLIGGAEYNYNQQNGGKILPKIGVQYKDIPTVITFDPENKSVSVGLTLKF